MIPRSLMLASSALAAVALAVTGCATAVPGAAQPGQPDQALQRFYDQQLAWGPCADFAPTAAEREAYAQPRFECARLEVPLDYAAPDGRTAQIAVLRQKAAGQDRIGSLIMNPGGPGASGNALVAQSKADALTGTPLGDRFDIVGFDPRGTGASTPTIDCLNDQEWAVERLDQDIDPSPAGVAQTEQENQEFVQRCVERSGGADALANFGTRDVVRDLDILRAALGDEKLTYVGYSYGTRIGSQYAEAFPQNVRALVLDGALDPTETTINRIIKQNEGFQKAFDAYAADCATQPTCPLGTDASQATQRIQVLMRPLIEQPLAVGNRQLSFNDAQTGISQALYSQQFWPILSRGLSGYASGDGRILMLLADAYYGRGEDGVYSNFIEAFNSISCVDEERIPKEQQAELIEAAEKAAPFRDDGQPAVAATDVCGFWPSPPTSQPHVPQVEGLPTTLVVSTTNDPATPYQAGVDLAEALGGSLLTHEGEGHTVALGGAEGVKCIDDAVTAYLIDLQVPASDPRCKGV